MSAHIEHNFVSQLENAEIDEAQQKAALRKIGLYMLCISAVFLIAGAVLFFVCKGFLKAIAIGLFGGGVFIPVVFFLVFGVVRSCILQGLVNIHIALLDVYRAARNV